MPDRPLVRFGLSISIEHGTGRPTFRLVDAIKDLFDGAVAAFHQHRSGPVDTDAMIADRLAVATGVSRPDVAELLDRPDLAVLGSRRLLFRRGAGLQWNPGDDGCVAGEILRLPVPGLDRVTLSGELFEVRPASG